MTFIRSHRRRRYVHRVPGHVRRPKLAQKTLDDLRQAGVQSFTTRDAYAAYRARITFRADEISAVEFSRMLTANQVRLGIKVIDHEARPVVWTWR